MIRRKNTGNKHGSSSWWRGKTAIFLKHTFEIVLAIVAASAGILAAMFFKPITSLDDQINQNFYELIANVRQVSTTTQQLNLVCQYSSSTNNTGIFLLNTELNARIALPKQVNNLVNSYQYVGSLLSTSTYCATLKISREANSIIQSKNLCSPSPPITDKEVNHVIGLIENDRQQVNAYKEYFQGQRFKLVQDSKCPGYSKP